jgi:WD40 repeat protein
LAEKSSLGITQPIKAHSKVIYSVDFSPDGTVLATGSDDGMTKFWCTKTWQMQGDPIEWRAACIRYSPSGELLAIATANYIQIYNPGTRELVASFKGHTNHNLSLAWTPDGTRLLSGGDEDDPTIREWDPLTWQQVGHPWEGHTDAICAIAINPAGTLVASASFDRHVRLWRLSDWQNIGVFQYSSLLYTTVTFSIDGRHILSGGGDNKISEWEVPTGAHAHAKVGWHF